jgi:hypothetical protein
MRRDDELLETRAFDVAGPAAFARAKTSIVRITLRKIGNPLLATTGSP